MKHEFKKKIVLNLKPAMPRNKVFIRYVNIVGMHYHAKTKDLTIDQPHVLKLEPDNKYDKKAVKVVDRINGETKAYLTRSSCSLIRPLLEMDLVYGDMFLKPKQPGKSVHNKVVQKCAIGFYATDQCTEMIRSLLKDSTLSLEVKPYKQ